eukprot:scaffold90313_cov34-Phaeocystis_antarctica.AAC.2
MHQSWSEDTGHLPPFRGTRSAVSRVVCESEGCRGAAMQERLAQATGAAPRTPFDPRRASMYASGGAPAAFYATPERGAPVRVQVWPDPTVACLGHVGDGGPGGRR